jgi:hypothetical protein
MLAKKNSFCSRRREEEEEQQQQQSAAAISSSNQQQHRISHNLQRSFETFSASSTLMTILFHASQSNSSSTVYHLNPNLCPILPLSRTVCPVLPLSRTCIILICLACAGACYGRWPSVWFGYRGDVSAAAPHLQYSNRDCSI